MRLLLLASLLLALPAAASDQAVVVTPSSLSVTGLKDRYRAEESIDLNVAVPRENVLRARVEVVAMRDDAAGAPLYQELRDYDRYTTVQDLHFGIALPVAERRGGVALLVRVRGLRSGAEGEGAEPFEESLTWRLTFDSAAANVAEGTRLQGRVFFAFDDATIAAKDQTVVDEWARVLLARRDLAELRVEGHADHTGRPNYNLDLSRRRAEAVRDALIARGVPGHLIRVVGFGFSKPESQRDMAPDEKGVWENRRAEVVWFSAGP